MLRIIPKCWFSKGSIIIEDLTFIEDPEYIGVHDYQNVLNLDYYFNIFQPSIVFEVAEYTFSDSYFLDSRKMLHWIITLYNKRK